MTTKAQAKEILCKVGLKGEWHRSVWCNNVGVLFCYRRVFNGYVS